MKLIALTLVLAAASMATQAQTPVYLDESRSIDERVEDALSRMSTADKIRIIHAQSKFSSAGVPALGIPELWTDDGPHGVRPEVLWDEWEQAGWTNDSCTAFPALTCLAATWNPELARLYGQSVGAEARYRGKDVLLGPGVNILRTPLNGRNFEYMGEDPWLAARMVVPYVRGLQSNGVAACVKHFALNNNELNRHTTNVILDDRALYEIYLPAFKAAVQEGGAWSIMAAYNLYGGDHLCHGNRLVNDILRGEWGFDGAVISDWGGVHSTDGAITGVDLEFGSWTNGLSNGASNAYDSYYLAMPYARMLAEGKADPKELDEKARRVLRLMMRTSMNTHKPFGAMGSEEHLQAARKIGGEGTVLLRNNGILPLDASKDQKILVVGENAIKMLTIGGGSSSLKARHEVLPLDGIREYAPGVQYARGYVGDPLDEYNGVRSPVSLEDKRTPAELIAEAVKMAREADVVIFVGGLNKAAHNDCEDSDRTDITLPYGQDELIAALAKANPNTVVVNISGNPVAMPWLDEVAAVVQGWYYGSESGHILADVLYGKTEPAGRLPFTMPHRLADTGAHSLGAYPGTPRNDGSHITDLEYKEGLYVGYRWNDKNKVKPLFPFGYGLSYTTFDWGEPAVVTAGGETASGKKGLEVKAGDKLKVRVPVSNTGKRSGSETVQVYVRDVKSSLPRPVKELKGFGKVNLAPGQTEVVEIELDTNTFAYFDDNRHEWVLEPGVFDLVIASDAATTRYTLPITLR